MNKYEIIKKLIKHYENDTDVLELIHDCMDQFASYVEQVSTFETRLSIAKIKMTNEDYLDFLKTLDERRRLTHNACISNVNILNRMCKASNIEVIYDGDITDRYKIGDTIGELINEAYKNRQ